MDFTQVIWVLNMAATAGLLIRLLTAGLVRVYPFLFAYILLDLIQALILASVPIRSNTYGYVYMVGTVLELFLAIAVVMELYSVALAEHPALAKFGSRTVGYVLLGAAAVAATALKIDETVPAGQPVILHRFFRVERTVDFGVVVFLAIISVFILWFPVRIKRNIIRYVVGFAVFYASRSVGLLFINVLPAWQRRLDGMMLTVSFACLLFLALRLRMESDSPVLARNSSDPAAVAQLTGQLEAINAALSRLARR